VNDFLFGILSHERISQHYPLPLYHYAWANLTFLIFRLYRVDSWPHMAFRTARYWYLQRAGRARAEDPRADRSL